MNFKLFVFTICLFCFSATHAQVIPVNIIQDLETRVPGQGLINIASESKITDLLGRPPQQANVDENAYTKVNGFRIQVFMSNNSKTARNEANHKESQIREIFPELATYVNYEAPNWKLLAGDFMTKEEAGIFRQKIQKAFPEFGREIYTVSCKINVPKNN
ncbi:MAG: SPOR domain-containing protein [Dysgonamonadaceae bacterium]|jgi:hypothetical protein|nr:SPOR domain-containing protein [Dysgonamonadaceae bacterium]